MYESNPTTIRPPPRGNPREIWLLKKLVVKCPSEQAETAVKCSAIGVVVQPGHIWYCIIYLWLILVIQGKRDGFLLCLYEKISSRLLGQFCYIDVVLTVVKNSLRRYLWTFIPATGQPACPYKRTIIFTIKITTQRDLAYRAVSLSGPARLPYKQALRINF
jgi:hypothetical protein